MISAEQKNNIFYLFRCLILSYIITFLILAVLALLLYKLSLGKGILSGILIVLYVAVNMLSGVLAGRHMKEKRYMWGLAVGSMYFAVLLLLTWFVPSVQFSLNSTLITTFLLCAGGGMLGGMVS
ncbi:MAG: TIGR04086 family membrane protein [Lachnospiraceae bacterium]|nr:TIGR04086 family membrane protein [Lachnospiraceae bacterium]